MTTQVKENAPERKEERQNTPFTTRMKASDFKNIGYNVETSSICNGEKLEEIAKDLKAAGVTSDRMFNVAFDLARHCADVGTSEFTNPIGVSNQCSLSRTEIAAIVKSKTTLRRFCAYFAKYVWNHMIMNDKPPANYLRKGFKESNKFAAFDTFYAINSEAALEPNGGIIRKPTQAEMSANISYAEVAIYRQVALNGNQNLNVGEITYGKSGVKAQCPINNK
uniref:Capsid protein n=1 Tax=Cymodocea nodosa foveavirus 1 TaxID=2794432 RepID=A0A7T5UFC3_9VIRU|nr:CP [Cymodocea nodosa foveavirus 1]